MPALDRESRTRQSIFLSLHTNIGTAFQATLRLWLTLSWVAYTMNMAWSRRLHEFLRTTPVSHPFVERLIGTIRREYLDRAFFWNAQDLERKLGGFLQYYNHSRVHQSLDGSAPAEVSGGHQPLPAKLSNYSWISDCNGLFQTPVAA